MTDLWDRLRAAQTRIDQTDGPPMGPDDGRSPQNGSAPAPQGWTWVTPLVAERIFTFVLEPRFWAAVGPGLDPADWENIFCFDTETTGLSGGAGTVPFLVGWASLVTPEGGGEIPAVEVRQWFLRDLPGEPDLVAAVDRALAGARGLVSFNGASFDLPLLKSRWILAGRDWVPVPHRDDLPRARRLWKRLMDSCRLVTVEETVLGIRRVGDVPGSLVPALWFDYLRRGAAADFTGLLGGVVQHHAQDVYSLLCLDLLMAALGQDPGAPRWTATFDPIFPRVPMARVAPGGLLHPHLGTPVPVDFWGLLSLEKPEDRSRRLKEAWDRSPTEAVGMAWAGDLKQKDDPRAKEVWVRLWKAYRSYPALEELAKWLEHRDRTTEDRVQALDRVNEALEAPFLPRKWRECLVRRRDRLARLVHPGL